jgi:hypothetical protein
MVKYFLLLLCAGLTLVGCASSTVQSRRTERLAAYQTLPAEQKTMVDQGQISVGMNQDAVYIAWGPPSEKLAGGDERGTTETWLYYGEWMQESRYWSYREVRRGGYAVMERYYTPQDYMRAEIVFAGGKVKSWRTLPRPAGVPPP